MAALPPTLCSARSIAHTIADSQHVLGASPVHSWADKTRSGHAFRLSPAQACQPGSTDLTDHTRRGTRFRPTPTTLNMDLMHMGMDMDDDLGMDIGSEALALTSSQDSISSATSSTTNSPHAPRLSRHYTIQSTVAEAQAYGYEVAEASLARPYTRGLAYALTDSPARHLRSAHLHRA
ncbi:uncharacterized protein MONBRDRAFT_37758 [Monosiga brevicollis MX1]|uniref:Uncharacterized protein n=1 Tax=Monosiga brevicollis TaxID=81824 RepID=A9V3U9_MONBE|nr:uncharacterized protein MONBRDRAFT_37758 [Monosiga brevicollis MX1]EDQ87870.1 predicted protein [Monosiga brevicollis MX1]|eukprot:XP_001747403.1 hypothetical protein [Monosiga brevicollis MX1]